MFSVLPGFSAPRGLRLGFFLGGWLLAATGASAAAPANTADTWPHQINGDRGSATVYQPQVISWNDKRQLDARIALAVTPTGAKEAAYGTLEVRFDTTTDLANRRVTLTHPVLLSARFPSLDASGVSGIEENARRILSGIGAKTVPLDMILMSLRHQADAAASAPLSQDPPRIFSCARPACLVVFDGQPVMTAVTNSTLTFAVNTNWEVFFDATTQNWFLLYNGAWLSAPDVRGPWLPAGPLPPAFASLPADGNFADVKRQIPGKTLVASDAPTVFVSTVPAAIIVTTGAPKRTSIPGTSLSFISNTDAALFQDNGGTYYYLVSGRWFSAPSLNGPWTFATSSLPADFTKIPANGPRGWVLPSVPGTPQAQEAVIQAQIPQEATLSRSGATLTVYYAGAPQFVPITGTSLLYAANTSFVVIQDGAQYYSCYQGAWFSAPSPNGPWTLTEVVPAVIYTIPPSCPIYPCTYVQVYASTPSNVTYGYTAGYMMGFVSAGVVLYGTGYYYPPYYFPAPIPIYYPYPYTYHGATYYNPATGAWAQGGAIYGPYGGVAKGGTAYNPTTGAWAQGGAIYGPYGGAGAFSAYNPTTGSYAHGSAVWGPDGAAGNASWYNANTGRSGYTQQNSNAYGRWGSTTISGPNQTVHMQSQSDSRGSAGSFSSSTGATGAGVSGAGGNRAGVVKGAGGDVYAGADGNVYKKTSDGWEKYDDGSWNSVKPPTQDSRSSQSPEASRTSRDALGADSPGTRDGFAGGAGQFPGASESGGAARFADRFGGGGFQGWNQLEQDRTARLGGWQRQSDFQEGRGAFSGGRGWGGGGGVGRGGFRR